MSRESSPLFVPHDDAPSQSSLSTPPPTTMREDTPFDMSLASSPPRSTSSVTPSSSLRLTAQLLPSSPSSPRRRAARTRRIVRATDTWSYFREAARGEITHHRGTANRMWYCLHCRGVKIYSTYVSNNARQHLKTRHAIFVEEDVPPSRLR
jgi:hypothetical protein